MFVPISSVRLPDWGWRKSDPQGLAKLVASLTRFGQVQPLLVRKVDDCYEVVDGRRRFMILQEMSEAGALPDGVQVTSLGNITKDEAIKRALALEVTGGVDYVQLAQHLLSLKDDPDYLSLPAFTPYSEERISYFATLLNFDWSQFDEAQASLLDDDTETHQFTAPEREEWAVPSPTVAAPQAAPTVDRAALRGLVRAAAPVRALDAVGAPTATAAPVAAAAAAARRRGVQVEVGADFSAPPIPDGWRPDTPPSLDDIDDIEVDTEATGLKWWDGDRMVGLALNLPDGRSFYLPTRHEGGGNLDEAVVHRWMERELRGKTITNANSRYDNHIIYNEGIDLEEQGCLWADVQHYAALLDEYRRVFNIEALGSEFLGEGKLDDGLDKNNMGAYHASQVAEYAKQDVRLVNKLKNYMLPKLEEQGLERVRKLECEVIYPVCEMERNAAYVDRGALNDAVERSANMLQDMLLEVSRQTGFSMNPDKGADWQRLFQALGIPIKHFTDKGAPSFTDAILSRIDNEVVQLARKAGRLASIRSKFLLPYAQLITEDSRLLFALNQLRGDEYGTIRGRFSMAGGGKKTGKYGANLQQVMRVNSQREAFGYKHDDSSHDHEIFLIRSFFVPKTGDFLSADAQSIEYRLAAHYANSERMIKAYQADYDKLARGELTGEWVDFHNTVGGFIRPYKDLSRNIVKNMNFCKIYGGGRDRVAEVLGMDRSQSDPIVSVYDNTFPEFAGLLRKASRLAETRGFVKTVLGRRARFHGHMRKYTHAALNYVIQGSAADVLKTKLVELHKARKWTGFLMRLTVHDEFDGDAQSPETLTRVREVLNRQSFPQLKVPIVWEVETGRSWAEAH